MTLPHGALNLQQVVRDLEKRITELEDKLKPDVEKFDGRTAQEASTPEPPTAD